MPASTTAPSLESSLTSVSILRLMRPSDSTTGVKATPMPNSLKIDADLAEAVHDGDRELAAGEELRRLARDGRQVWLGQRAHQAVALERAQGAVDRLIA